MRSYIYTFGAGALTLAVLTIYLTPPKRIVTEITSGLPQIMADVDDSGFEIVEYVPIPQRKPSPQGYTLAYIEDMNDFIEGFK